MSPFTPWPTLEEREQRSLDESSSHRIVLHGSQLRASADLEVPGSQRLSDYFGLLQGFCRVTDMVLLTHRGKPARTRMPSARIRLDQIVLIGESRHCPCTDGRPAQDSPALFVAKNPQRVIVMTNDHLIYGVAHLSPNGSLAAFIDAEHPRFVPLTNVRIRRLADRSVAGRYDFALLQRTHIMGFQLQPGGDAAVESFHIPGADFGAAQSWS